MIEILNRIHVAVRSAADRQYVKLEDVIKILDQESAKLPKVTLGALGTSRPISNAAHQLFTLCKDSERFVHQREIDAAFYALGAAMYGENDPRVQKLRPKPTFRVGDLLADTHENGEFAFVVEVNAAGTHVLDYRGAAFSTTPRLISDERSYRAAKAEEIARVRGDAC